MRSYGKFPELWQHRDNACTEEHLLSEATSVCIHPCARQAICKTMMKVRKELNNIYGTLGTLLFNLLTVVNIT